MKPKPRLRVRSVPVLAPRRGGRAPEADEFPTPSSTAAADFHGCEPVARRHSMPAAVFGGSSPAPSCPDGPHAAAPPPASWRLPCASHSVNAAAAGPATLRCTLSAPPASPASARTASTSRYRSASSDASLLNSFLCPPLSRAAPRSLHPRPPAMQHRQHPSGTPHAWRGVLSAARPWIANHGTARSSLPARIPPGSASSVELRKEGASAEAWPACPHGRSTVASTSTTFGSLVNPRRWKPIPNALPGLAAALRPPPPTSGRISQTGGGLGSQIGASQPHHGQTLRVAPRGSAPWYDCARLGVPRGCTSNAPSGNNRLSIFNIPCSAAPRDPLREAGRGDGRCVRCGGHCRRKSDGSGGSPAHSPPSWLRECAAGLREPVLRSRLPSPARARQCTGTALSP